MADSTPQKYAGMAFETKNSIYIVTQDCRISGRDSLEGARIERLSGVTPNVFNVYRQLGLDSRESIGKMILEFGIEPCEGNHLLLNLTEGDSEKYRRPGLITTAISRIRPATSEELRKAKFKQYQSCLHSYLPGFLSARSQDC